MKDKDDIIKIIKQTLYFLEEKGLIMKIIKLSWDDSQIFPEIYFDSSLYKNLYDYLKIKEKTIINCGKLAEDILKKYSNYSDNLEWAKSILKDYLKIKKEKEENANITIS